MGRGAEGHKGGLEGMEEWRGQGGEGDIGITRISL